VSRGGGRDLHLQPWVLRRDGCTNARRAVLRSSAKAMPGVARKLALARAPSMCLMDRTTVDKSSLVHEVGYDYGFRWLFSSFRKSTTQ
jgi:hypothetical protein